MDMWGPLNIVSFQGFQYFLTVVDDFTRHTWIYLLKTKADTRSCIFRFITYISNQFKCIAKTI